MQQFTAVRDIRIQRSAYHWSGSMTLAAEVPPVLNLITILSSSILLMILSFRNKTISRASCIQAVYGIWMPAVLK